MFFISINDNDSTPVYRQIVDNVRSEIAAGRLKPGEALPSVRELASKVGINVNTALKAYQILQQMKVVVSRQARGFTVATDVKDLLGSAENQRFLALQLEGILDEAARLGFSAKDVVRMIMKSKRYNKSKTAK